MNFVKFKAYLMILNCREKKIKAIEDGFHSIIPLSNIKDGISCVNLGVIITGEKDFEIIFYYTYL
jgi:hypothetical protein